MAGFDLRHEVIRTMPVSLSPELPEHKSQGAPVFVYGGVFLPWQDSVTSVLFYATQSLLLFPLNIIFIFAVYTGKFIGVERDWA